MNFKITKKTSCFFLILILFVFVSHANQSFGIEEEDVIIQVTKIYYPINVSSSTESSTSFKLYFEYSIIVPEGQSVGGTAPNSAYLHPQIEIEVEEESATAWFVYYWMQVPTPWYYEPGTHNETWPGALYMTIGELPKFPIGNYSIWMEFHFGEASYVTYYKAYINVTESGALITYEHDNNTETYIETQTTNFYSVIFLLSIMMIPVIIFRRKKK
jgi:hypothetical protein